MSEWKTYKLVDVAERIGDGLHGTPEYDENGEYYFINGSNLINGKIVVNLNTKRVNETEYLKHKKDLSENTILLGINGTIGNVALYQNEQCILGKSAAYINVKSEFDKQFIRYVLTNEHFQRFIRTNASGTTIKNVGLGLLREYEFQAPKDIEEQRQIAQILSSLDDKIELNLHMNQTLEAMAQAIFKEWFVNFNYPGFDGELVDGLPKGWRVGVLGELVEKLSKGTTPTQKDLGSLEVQIPFLKVKDISDNGTIIKNNLELIPIEVHQNQLKRSVLQTDDILFSIAGTIGRVAILDNTLNNSNCNQAIAFIRLTEKSKYLEYVHQWLKSETVQNNIKSSIVQGVQANVSLTVLSNIDIVIPDDTTIEYWNSLIKPTYSRLLTNTHQIENLTQTRDTLLPKLMSGQLEVAV